MKYPTRFCSIYFCSAENSLVDVWNERFPLPDNDFEFLEPLLALRSSMLKTLVILRSKKNDSREDVINLARAYKDFAVHLEMQAKMARRSNNPQVGCLRFLVLLLSYLRISFHLCFYNDCKNSRALIG